MDLKGKKTWSHPTKVAMWAQALKSQDGKHPLPLASCQESTEDLVCAWALQRSKACVRGFHHCLWAHRKFQWAVATSQNKRIIARADWEFFRKGRSWCQYFAGRCHPSLVHFNPWSDPFLWAGIAEAHGDGTNIGAQIFYLGGIMLGCSGQHSFLD